MFFWKMFFIASFTYAPLMLTMFCTIMMSLISPGAGLVCLLIHIGVHAPFLYRMKAGLDDESFRKLILKK